MVKNRKHIALRVYKRAIELNVNLLADLPQWRYIDSTTKGMVRKMWNGYLAFTTIDL